MKKGVMICYRRCVLRGNFREDGMRSQCKVGAWRVKAGLVMGREGDVMG